MKDTNLAVLLRRAVSESVREALRARHERLVQAKLAASAADFERRIKLVQAKIVDRIGEEPPPTKGPMFVILRLKWGLWVAISAVYETREGAKAHVKGLSRQADARLPHIVVEVQL